MQGIPPAEIDVDTSLVRSLLLEQHADLSHLTLSPAESGWDNSMFRLGDALAVRLPRRAIAVSLIEHEQRWLPRLARRLPLPVPVPIRIGQPGCGFPWTWSILPWLPGTIVGEHPAGGHQAPRLAAFLTALHVAAPPEAPVNPYRGVPLAHRAESLAASWSRLDSQTALITTDIRHAWQSALDAPIDVEPTWIHGDLHARNILADKGTLTGVIDWGDVTRGDRATDLASIWMVFEEAASRDAAMRACTGVSDATWVRARGWAIYFASVFADTGLANDPQHARLGELILRRVREGP